MGKIIALLFILSFASCRKEYTCGDGKIYKQGSYEFERISKTQTISYNGNIYMCY